MVRLTETTTAPVIGEPNQTQFVQVERERERAESARHRGNWDQWDTSNGGPTTDRWGGEISPLVDVDSQKPIRSVRTKSYRLPANQEIAGTYLDYWMWLCRPNPRDAEPKPVPSIQTPK